MECWAYKYCGSTLLRDVKVLIVTSDISTIGLCGKLRLFTSKRHISNHFYRSFPHSTVYNLRCLQQTVKAKIEFYSSPCPWRSGGLSASSSVCNRPLLNAGIMGGGDQSVLIYPSQASNVVQPMSVCRNKKNITSLSRHLQQWKVLNWNAKTSNKLEFVKN